MNLFGGVWGAVQSEAARKEWQKLSENDLRCIEIGAEQSNTTINDLVKKGIMPSNENIKAMLKVCRELASLPVKSSYACTLKLTDGRSISTQCNTGIFIFDGRDNVGLSLEEAYRYAFSGRGEQMKHGEYETQQGIAARRDAEPPLDIDQRKGIQTVLKELGHYNAQVDGDFGAGTRTAIKSFQSREGASETGYLTPGQAQSLIDRYNQRFRQTKTQSAPPRQESSRKSGRQMGEAIFVCRGTGPHAHTARIYADTLMSYLSQGQTMAYASILTDAARGQCIELGVPRHVNVNELEFYSSAQYGTYYLQATSGTVGSAFTGIFVRD